MTLLLLATTNAGKAREFQEIFAAQMPSNSGLTLATPFESGLTLPEVEETGETFAENAVLKARALALATGKYALADDSGLCVDALNGAPGVRSARWGGPNLTNAERIALLLSHLEVIPDVARGARFVCALALAAPDGRILGESHGVCVGVITRFPRGVGGFGYDPIFEIPALGRTLAELSPAVKHSLSHRFVAFQNLGSIFLKIFPTQD